MFADEPDGEKRLLRAVGALAFAQALQALCVAHRVRFIRGEFGLEGDTRTIQADLAGAAADNGEGGVCWRVEAQFDVPTRIPLPVVWGPVLGKVTEGEE